MSTSKIAPLHTGLDFNSPLSDARVSRIIRTLQPLDGARVAEVGCGWAELLLRIAAAQPSVTTGHPASGGKTGQRRPAKG
jgi:hypothetical protein